MNKQNLIGFIQNQLLGKSCIKDKVKRRAYLVCLDEKCLKKWECAIYCQNCHLGHVKETGHDQFLNALDATPTEFLKTLNQFHEGDNINDIKLIIDQLDELFKELENSLTQKINTIKSEIINKIKKTLKNDIWFTQIQKIKQEVEELIEGINDVNENDMEIKLRKYVNGIKEPLRNFEKISEQIGKESENIQNQIIRKINNTGDEILKKLDYLRDDQLNVENPLQETIRIHNKANTKEKRNSIQIINPNLALIINQGKSQDLETENSPKPITPLLNHKISSFANHVRSQEENQPIYIKNMTLDIIFFNKNSTSNVTFCEHQKSYTKSLPAIKNTPNGIKYKIICNVCSQYKMMVPNIGSKKKINIDNIDFEASNRLKLVIFEAGIVFLKSLEYDDKSIDIADFVNDFIKIFDNNLKNQIDKIQKLLFLIKYECFIRIIDDIKKLQETNIDYNAINVEYIIRELSNIPSIKKLNLQSLRQQTKQLNEQPQSQLQAQSQQQTPLSIQAQVLTQTQQHQQVKIIKFQYQTKCYQ